MSKKAVYSNKGLQVYITGEDFEDLLRKTVLDVPLYIGKAKTADGWIVVKTLSESWRNLDQALTLERQAVNQARQASGLNIFRYE